MRLPEFFNTTAFRWAVAFAAVLAVAMLAVSGFIYWRTVSYFVWRADSELLEDAQMIVRAPPAEREDAVQRYLRSDEALLKIAGWFDESRHPLAGNLAEVPAGLPKSQIVGEIRVPITIRGRTDLDPVRVLALPIAGGGLLVLGRSVRAVKQIQEIVARALIVALVPTILLAFVGGAMLSQGALKRIAGVHRTARLIMAGQMKERLPVRGGNDDFDKLARIVNDMLDEIERLMIEARGAGEDIAHDLRTPLTRLRGRIERAQSTISPGHPLTGTLERAIDDIDQILGTITAILRIAEVEHGLRRSGFRQVDLADVVREAVDLYDPAAEAKEIVLMVTTEPATPVLGDGDLLCEAVANLLDNAIKFTPEYGRIEVLLQQQPAGPSIRIADSGPGIPRADFSKVLRRFHRGDRSRNTPGVGLGLSLVGAVARLHGYGLVLLDRRAGCCIDLECWPHEGTGGPAVEAVGQ